MLKQANNVMEIGISKPFIGEEEKQAVLAVLESGQVTQGLRVAQFERQFAEYHGAEFGVATNNGTSALMVMMMAHGIGPGDEVIVPAFTFFATASSVLAVGATPIFADIDPVSYCMSPTAAEAAITNRTRAIMPVHLFGHPADMPAFKAICDRYGLLLLEDAAQAHGAAIGNAHVGSWGSAAFSFYATKNIMTAEGGMILTNDGEAAERMRMFRNQGMSTQYFHEVAGHNYRMTDINAALGIVQMSRLHEWTQQRIQNAAEFNLRIHSLQTPATSDGYTHVFHQYTVRVPDGLSRDDVLKQLQDQAIGARVYYPLPIHQQPVFQRMPEYADVHLPETERAAQQVLSLPVHPHLTQAERDHIVDVVNALA